MVYLVITDPKGNETSQLPEAGLILDAIGLFAEPDGFYTLSWQHKGRQDTYTVQLRAEAPSGSEYKYDGVRYTCSDTACVVNDPLGRRDKFAEVNFFLNLP